VAGELAAVHRGDALVGSHAPHRPDLGLLGPDTVEVVGAEQLAQRGDRRQVGGGDVGDDDRQVMVLGLVGVVDRTDWSSVARTCRGRRLVARAECCLVGPLALVARGPGPPSFS
jgi:hypothetical protein